MDEGIFVLDNKNTPVPLGIGVGESDMKPPRPKEARMNRKIDSRIEAMSCLLARSGLQPPSRTSAIRIANAARLLDKSNVSD
jgi:hypothetical protein